MSLAEDVRPISRTSPSMCWKIRNSSRRVTVTIMPGHWKTPIIAGRQRYRVLAPHRVATCQNTSRCRSAAMSSSQSIAR
jgi:hypothetical protein